MTTSFFSRYWIQTCPVLTVMLELAQSRNLVGQRRASAQPPDYRLTENVNRKAESGSIIQRSSFSVHHSFEPRLAQGGKLTLQDRRVFDRRSLLVNLQRKLGIEPQHFRRLGPGFCLFA